MGIVAAIQWAVLCAVFKIVLLILVGVKLEYQGMLNNTKRKTLSALAMDVCLPCLLFSDVLPEADAKLLMEGWELVLWPLVYCIVGASTGVLACMAVGTPSRHWGAAAACAAFPNVNGFPVSVIQALGPAIPRSPAGFSPMTFLAIVQLTDGMFKYTIGPLVFRWDLRAVQRARMERGESHNGELPLGASLRSIDSQIVNDACAHAPSSDHHEGKSEITQFGLLPEQYKAVEPEWSRMDSGKLVFSLQKVGTAAEALHQQGLDEPLLPPVEETKSGRKSIVVIAREVTMHLQAASKSSADFLRQLFPPQVTAVILALALGLGPPEIKDLLYDKELQAKGITPPLGWLYGTAKALGAGFVPLQMISLGGRMLNVVGDKGPLAAKGAAGPGGRNKLLRISAAVGVARMLVTPAVLYGLAYLFNSCWFKATRPMAFWAPALIVGAMPTANNMSTMSDLIGAGRSISSASTALQLLASPFVLAASLTMILVGARVDLAADAT